MYAIPYVNKQTIKHKETKRLIRMTIHKVDADCLCATIKRAKSGKL